MNASNFVIKHGRRCNTSEVKYVCRYPVTASRAMFAPSVEELVEKVEAAMTARAALSAAKE